MSVIIFSYRIFVILFSDSIVIEPLLIRVFSVCRKLVLLVKYKCECVYVYIHNIYTHTYMYNTHTHTYTHTFTHIYSKICSFPLEIVYSLLPLTNQYKQLLTIVSLYTSGMGSVGRETELLKDLHTAWKCQDSASLCDMQLVD